MAGVVNGVQQVVSSHPATDNSPCDAFDSQVSDVVDNFPFTSNTNNDLLDLNPAPRTDADLSLQDLIDSELALRIKTDQTDALLVDLSNGDAHQEDESEDSEANSVERRPDCGVVNGNLVTDFLDHERSHTDLTDQDNSLSLSLSLSSNAAPLCSGEGDDLEMASELGSEGPADSDFSPNVPDLGLDDVQEKHCLRERPEEEDEVDSEPDLLADEATLAEDISLASDRSQERTGSLLDLEPLRPDSPPDSGPGPGSGLSPTDLADTRPTGLPTDTGLGPGPERELRTVAQQEGGGLEAEEEEEGKGASPLGSPLGLRSEESDAVLSAADAAATEEHQGPAASVQVASNVAVDEAASSADDVDAGVNVLAEERPQSPVPAPACPTSVCANPLSVTNNSMDVFPSAVVSVGDPAGFEDGFETWSTVEEVAAGQVADASVEEVCDADPESEAQLSSVNSDTETVQETSEKKTVTKKKKVDGAESTKKKSKKTKKSEEKENISVRRSFGDLRHFENSENGVDYQPEEDIISEGKSSFSKFDQLSKKTVLHVRSVDASKVQKQFNEATSTSPDAHTNCKACGKQVFVMEQIKAEKALWHKNCFRCKECNKQLTVDTYSSHEGDIYCKPHFRELFKPKAVVEDSPEPASDKPDLGLEELSSLNVKSRFQVFEKSEESKTLDVEKSPSSVNVKRSPSILSKLAKFQAKGMDIGVTDESLNGIPYEESSTSSEEEEEDGEGDEENGDIVKSSRTARERPMSFSKMEDVKSRWETGSAAKKEERREERKQEIQSIRSRLFMGKQGKMKEMYEQAVKESEQPAARRGAEVRSEKAKSIKEKFERGETLVSDEEADEEEKRLKDDDLGVFEAGISKKSRSLFLELDASAAKTAQQSPPVRSAAVKESTKKREMDSPEREVYRDPDVVRAEDPAEGDELQHSMTTSKMLSIFRQMEEKAQRDDVPDGPKPLKCFTPPPDYKPESGSSEDDRSDEEDDDEEDDDDEEEDTGDGVIRSTVKTEDEFLKAAKEAAKAKTLRAKFEHWEEQENNINAGGGNINPALLESEHESIESTKSLRARFESLRKESEAPKEKPRPKVNRFVEIQTSCAEYCDSCEKKVYPLEKVETGGKLFHKGCFRCMQCSCILRMDSYTLNNGKLYCIPHFKQLFISKGNYDEGFGLDQHKRKWNSPLRENGDILLSGIDVNGNNN